MDMPPAVRVNAKTTPPILEQIADCCPREIDYEIHRQTHFVQTVGTTSRTGIPRFGTVPTGDPPRFARASAVGLDRRSQRHNVIEVAKLVRQPLAVVQRLPPSKVSIGDD